jgi:hypothetical protein
MGSITDASGGAIPNVAVDAVQLQTNYRYSSKSNETGQYTLPNLLDGTYTLEARAAGFQDFKAENIVLAVRGLRRVDIPLSVGQVGTQLEVAGGVSLIETESARISDTKDRVVLRNMPLTLGRAWDYFTLSPQVTFQRNGFQMRFAGSRNNQAEVTIDGTSIARSGGGFASGPLLDRTESFQELRLDIANTGAEFATMGQVSIISRSGTNEFHGTFSDYYGTPAFAARDPFALSRTGNVSHRMNERQRACANASGPLGSMRVHRGTNPRVGSCHPELLYRHRLQRGQV